VEMEKGQRGQGMLGIETWAISECGIREREN